MNTNKTILATLVASSLSFNALAEKVDVVAANQATQKAIISQMDAIDASVLAKLNAQNERVVELNGVTYEQDEKGVWAVVGASALGLTAALLSGSTGGSGSPDDNGIPDYDFETGAVPDGEGQEGVNGWSVANGQIYYNGVETLNPMADGTLVNQSGDVVGTYVKAGEGYFIYDMNGNPHAAWTKDNGFVLANTPDVDFGPITDGDGVSDQGPGAQGITIVDGGIFKGGEKIGFIAADGNVNLYNLDGSEGNFTIGTAKYNGEGTLVGIDGVNGNNVVIRPDRITIVGESNTVTISKINGSVRVEADKNYGVDAPSNPNRPIIDKDGSVTPEVDVEKPGNDRLDRIISGELGGEVHISGNDYLITMVNGEQVKLHNVERTDDRNVSFSSAGQNYNLHKKHDGTFWIQQEQGNGTGSWKTIGTGQDVLNNIGERRGDAIYGGDAPVRGGNIDGKLGGSEVHPDIDYPEIPGVDNKPGTPDVDNKPIAPEVDNKPGLPDAEGPIADNEASWKVLHESAGSVFIEVTDLNGSKYDVRVDKLSGDVFWKGQNLGNVVGGQVTLPDSGRDGSLTPEISPIEWVDFTSMSKEIQVRTLNGLVQGSDLGDDAKNYMGFQANGRFSGTDRDGANQAALNMLTSGEMTVKQITVLNNVSITNNGADSSLLTTMLFDAAKVDGGADAISNAWNSNENLVQVFGEKTYSEILAASQDRSDVSREKTAKVIKALLNVEAGNGEHMKAMAKAKLKDKIDNGEISPEKLTKLQNMDKTKLQSIKAKIKARFAK
ncbi:hypothetical protein [Vibrio splendidus]|uniref:hypothetical protein n=1 Tax=Vibrio splendidus TaxID=29497 RepID=UPI000B2C34AD|nr:hypothetical protein [Vibrio splendidus]PHX05295.1 hypothetical protein VSPL_30780 [Vibrio splendidus]